MHQGKNNACFGKGHPQLIRTVRLSGDGVHYQLVNSGEIMTMASEGYFYYRIKPGSVREKYTSELSYTLVLVCGSRRDSWFDVSPTGATAGMAPHFSKNLHSES